MKLSLLAIGSDRWEFEDELSPDDAVRRVDLEAAFHAGSSGPPVIKDEHRLESIHEYCFPVRSQVRDLLAHLHCGAYRAHDGTTWAEVRFASDSIHHPMGYQKLDGLWIALDGKTLIDTRPLADAGHHIDLFDQGSSAFALGRPLALHSPTLDAHPLLEVPKRAWEKCKKHDVARVIERSWSKRDPRGEDHWGHTQNVGSAGAKYRDHRLTAYLAWRDGMISTDTYRDVLSAAHHFVLEQYGAAFQGEQGWVYVAGRPYHLFDYTGKRPAPFDRDKYPTTPIYQGTVTLRRGRNWAPGEGVDTLGRIDLPIHDVRTMGWDERDWVGKRVIGFPTKTPDQVTTRGRNGYDAEHDYRDKSHQLFCFTPSVFAHNSLINMYETSRPAEWER